MNDYLASRDADWMGKIYRFLGLTVGVNLSQMPHHQKQQAYAADITYGTNNEYGFDYLRDNMVYETTERVQRPLHYAIVDEVDSILIDEARTPLIISGQADDNTDLYYRINELVPKLARQQEEEGPGDYHVDEKAHQVLLTEAGHERAEQLMTDAGLLAPGGSLYDAANITLMHYLYASLRAHSLFFRDQHYVVQNGEVVIVDEFTGRLMAGRRWSDGLHQAVEAKEGVQIQKENQTLASITFQNYFRMYQKLAGMTGTADTEAYEFQQIYNLETVVIPTHRDMIREDRMDQVFRTADEKYQAVIGDIKDCYARGQPVLVGTTSIENNDLLSRLLDKEKLPHQVLNAKQHAREAHVIAQAGRPKMVTIATNMAGRGTDIILGGNPEPEVVEVQADETLPPEKKEARIADIRAEVAATARAGDRQRAACTSSAPSATNPAASTISCAGARDVRATPGRAASTCRSKIRCCASLRPTASGRSWSDCKMPEGEPIEHPWVTRAIENAQRKVEARNFDIRKQLLEYDDVSNEQRRIVYADRNQLLESSDVTETLGEWRNEVVDTLVSQHVPPQSLEEQWDVPALEKTLAADLKLQLPVQDWLQARAGCRRGAVAQPHRCRCGRNLRGEGCAGRPRRDASVRTGNDAAEPGHPLARAPVGARPLATGHPPARLRAEESEAGIQARGLRAVLGDVRAGQDRSHAHTHERAGAHGGGSGSGCRAVARTAERALSACRLRRGARRSECSSRRRNPSCVPARRSVATTRARAAPARSTSSATAS